MNRSCVVLLVVLGLVATSASAETIRVPKDYGSLQMAIDAAQAGDTIVVTGGTYPGILLVQSHTDLTIKGKKSPVVSDFDVVGCQRVRIEGFVVEGSTGGAALYGWASRDITFRKCTIRDTAGDGVLTDLCNDLVVEKCRFDRIGNDGITVMRATGASLVKNRMSGVGEHGIDVQGGSDNRVEKNVLADCGACGVLIEGSKGNVVRKNEASEGPYGFACADSEDNLFEKNKATAVGLGYHLFQGADNTLVKNTATDVGGGIEIVSSVDAGPGKWI